MSPYKVIINEHKHNELVDLCYEYDKALDEGIDYLDFADALDEICIKNNVRFRFEPEIIQYCIDNKIKCSELTIDTPIIKQMIAR